MKSFKDEDGGEMDLRETFEEIQYSIDQMENRIQIQKKEIDMWRNWMLSAMPLMINEDRDARIRSIYLNLHSKEFENRSPMEVLNKIMAIFDNPSQPKLDQGKHFDYGIANYPILEEGEGLI